MHVRCMIVGTAKWLPKRLADKLRSVPGTSFAFAALTRLAQTLPMYVSGHIFCRRNKRCVFPNQEAGAEWPWCVGLSAWLVFAFLID